MLISHDRRFLENLSRAVVWLDRGRTQRLEQGFAAFEIGATRCWKRKRSNATSGTAKSPQELDWLRHGRSGRRKRNQGRLARLSELADGRREELKRMGSVKMEAVEGAQSGTKVIDAKGVAKSFGDKTSDPGFLLAHPSRRPHRHRRTQRRGQNHPAQTSHRRTRTPDAGNVKMGTGLELAGWTRTGRRFIPKTVWPMR